MRQIAYYHSPSGKPLAPFTGLICDPATGVFRIMLAVGQGHEFSWHFSGPVDPNRYGAMLEDFRLKGIDYGLREWFGYEPPEPRMAKPTASQPITLDDLGL